MKALDTTVNALDQTPKALNPNTNYLDLRMKALHPKLNLVGTSRLRMNDVDPSMKFLDTRMIALDEN